MFAQQFEDILNYFKVIDSAPAAAPHSANAAATGIGPRGDSQGQGAPGDAPSPYEEPGPQDPGPPADQGGEQGAYVEDDIPF